MEALVACPISSNRRNCVRAWNKENAMSSKCPIDDGCLYAIDVHGHLIPIDGARYQIINVAGYVYLWIRNNGSIVRAIYVDDWRCCIQKYTDTVRSNSTIGTDRTRCNENLPFAQTHAGY